MNFERPAKSHESQMRLEKLQSLSHKEKLVLFELAYRIGVTPRKETTTNFLSQLHPDHLAGLSEKWQEVTRQVGDQGREMTDLSDAEMETLLAEVIDEEK